jgi:hypothetical protein
MMALVNGRIGTGVRPVKKMRALALARTSK